jgi:hypothetical protein
MDLFAIPSLIASTKTSRRTNDVVFGDICRSASVDREAGAGTRGLEDVGADGRVDCDYMADVFFRRSQTLNL